MYNVSIPLNKLIEESSGLLSLSLERNLCLSLRWKSELTNGVLTGYKCININYYKYGLYIYNLLNIIMNAAHSLMALDSSSRVTNFLFMHLREVHLRVFRYFSLFSLFTLDVSDKMSFLIFLFRIFDVVSRFFLLI